MAQTSFDNYLMSGDVGVIAICFVIVILLMSSYVSRTRSLRIFMSIIILLIGSALVNIIYHILLVENNPAFYNFIYALRILYQAGTLSVFLLFALYITVISGMNRKMANVSAIIAVALLVTVLGVDLIKSVCGIGFSIEPDGTVVNRSNIFVIGYILYVILLSVLMIYSRNLVYKRVVYGFIGTLTISVAIRFGQLAVGQSSLTTMTYVFPVIAMLYIMHSNPYNVTLGSVDDRAMEDHVRDLYTRHAPFLFLSLLLPEFDEEGREIPEELRSLIRRNSVEYFRGGVLFQISNGHVVLIVPKRRNPDHESRVQNILASFRSYYKKFLHPFKIVIGESIEDISRKNEYASLIRSIEHGMPDNSVHMVEKSDIDRFNLAEYILRELTDIYNKKDLDDPRVLAFCQPVFDIITGSFDTAEALMRLDLPETGIVTPDKFIPLAENHGYIHVLTEIILNKTCREIRRLTEEGYTLSRISVNVSVIELKEEEFCADVSGIIDSNGIPGSMIAIELTESRNEYDFMIMKKKIDELRRKGIQFYLDDFGTGYSNMERIMELPFDIIKFDRSMVIASGTGERSERIVENLAHMFKDMDYSVLYEGVEDDSDEKRCRGMSASYLQGFKYSRPVPIERLREFLPKA